MNVSPVCINEYVLAYQNWRADFGLHLISLDGITLGYSMWFSPKSSAPTCLLPSVSGVPKCIYNDIFTINQAGYKRGAGFNWEACLLCLIPRDKDAPRINPEISPGFAT